MTLTRSAIAIACLSATLARAGFQWTHITGGSLPTFLHVYGDTLYMGTGINLTLLDTRTQALKVLNTGNHPLMTNDIEPYLDSKGGLWTGSIRGVYRIQGGRAERRSIPNAEIERFPIPTGFEEDAEGRVWAPTWPGLIRFDAESTVVFDSTNSPVRGLPEPWDVAPSGRVWIAANGKLHTYQGGQWAPHADTSNCGLGRDLVRIREDSLGRLWMLGQRRLKRWDANGCQEIVAQFPSGYGGPFLSTLELRTDLRLGPGGEAWIDFNNGLLRVSDDTTFFDMTGGPAPLGSWGPPRFAVGGPDLLWVRTHPGFIHRFTPSTRAWESIPVGDPMAPMTPRCLWVDRAGIPWFGSHEGLRIYEDGAWKMIYGDTARSASLDSQWIADIAGDAEGRIWTRIGSMVRVFRDRKMELSMDYVPPFDPRRLDADPMGRILVGASQAGAHLYARFEGRTWTAVATPPECSGCIASGFGFDTAGAVWIGTQEGLFRHGPSGDWTRYHPGNSGLPVKSIFSVAVDGAGRVYAAHAQGLSLFDGLTWKTFGSADFGPRAPSITRVQTDRKGRAWVSHGGSMGRDYNSWMGVYDGTWTFLSEAEGLPDYASEDFAFGPDGKGWFATPSGACYLTETPTGIRLRRLPAPAANFLRPAVDILGRPARGGGINFR